MVFENSIACAMPHQVGSPGSARLRRRRPDLGRLFVTQVERLAGPVRDRVVGPGSQAVLTAVKRPGVAAAGLGYQEAKPWVGHHIDPGGRWLLPWIEVDHVLAAVGTESAQPIIESQPGRAGHRWNRFFVLRHDWPSGRKGRQWLG